MAVLKELGVNAEDQKAILGGNQMRLMGEETSIQSQKQAKG
jgi:hypothetical protein